MRVDIIGAGRLGSALAQRSVQTGHETRVLCRSLKSRSIRRLPKQVTLETITSADTSEIDLVLIAAPTWADQRKEALIRSFLRRVDPVVPICSAAAYPGVDLGDLDAEHPFLRFMCSPAIASLDYKPIVIACGKSQRSRIQFSDWVGDARILFTTPSNFERHTSLFFATALHCETLRRVQAKLKPKVTKNERRFAATTLLEAFTLLEAYDFEEKRALEACLTPRGLTRQAISSFFQTALAASDGGQNQRVGL